MAKAVETVCASRLVRLGRDRAPALVDAFRRADLVVVSAPVAVDSLPALVISGLTLLANPDLGPRTAGWILSAIRHGSLYKLWQKPFDGGERTR